MTWFTEHTPRRLGLLGDPLDPVLQLLQDVPGLEETDLIPIYDAPEDWATVDAVFVPDQDVALAHLHNLRTCPCPVILLLRRRGPEIDALEWQMGLDWLRAALDAANGPAFQLVALTSEAATALSTELGHPVTPLPPLFHCPGRKPVVPIERDNSVLTFQLEQPNGSRDPRRASIDCFNWVRLRRLSTLHALDSDDLDMGDLTAFCNGVDRATTSSQDTLCILAVIPNGTGLGHLTRVMAVARALEQTHAARVVFWSFSRAAEIIQKAGFEVILRQTCPHLGAHPPDWRQWETYEFARTIRALDARVVIYDGGSLDPFIPTALRQPGCGRCGLAWIRRGMLQPDTDAQLLEIEQYCDLVLEPGDLAVAEDKGPTRTRKAQNQGFSEFLYTPPVTLKAFLPDHPRRFSKRRLKLGWGRHCLVSLGGAFGNWDRLVNLMDKAAHKHGVTLIWAKSPLAPPPSAEETRNIRQIFPISPYMAGFDGVITATGYNSFHEQLLHFKGPILFAPTNNDRLDDQEARARFAGTSGWADVIYADQPQDHEALLDAFMKRVAAGEVAPDRPSGTYGAVEMAEAIHRIGQRYVIGG